MTVHLLVRLGYRTYPLDPDACLLTQLSDRTGWPSHRLRVTSRNDVFASVVVVSQLRGGKGGFGTLLKSQKAGGGTTDFGMCRDLQGRRLNAVNDQLLMQIMKQAEGNPEDQARALVDTPSGIAGWFLPIPHWAEGISKAQTRVYKNQLRNYMREKKALQDREAARKEEKDRAVQSYVQESLKTTQALESSIQSAVQQGMRKRKREGLDHVASAVALQTLSGDIALGMQNNRWRVQSLSNFGSIGVYLTADAASQTTYYELLLVTGGLVQCGWTNDITSFAPNSGTGEGVGDDDVSYAYDGSRRISLRKGETHSYGDAWKAGSVVGCLMRNSKVHFLLDGKELGTAFELDSSKATCIPVLSLNPGEVVELRLSRDEMEHLPADAYPVGDYLAEESLIEALNKQKKVVAKKREQAWRKQDAAKDKPVAAAEKAPPQATVVEPLDLSQYTSIQDLEKEGLDRLKGALMALGVKCGGTLAQRAERLYSLKGLEPHQYPSKLLAKKTLS